MSFRNKLSLFLILLSLVFLYPGLTLPMMNINAGTTLPILGELILYNETQSIVQTISALIDNDNPVVAMLILLFSVLVPVLKALILFIILIFSDLTGKESLYRFVAVISKWSMADVFVVGVFIAFLATKSNPHINATLHPGFFYFASYCILSIIGVQLMAPDSKSDNRSPCG
jgi:paraquat-inducible protein A